jgi:tetratricopeptide (TPR) repeat protein
VIVACVGVAVSSLTGCGRSGRSDNEHILKDNHAAELGEARRLAAEAQAEQHAGHSDRAVQLYQQSLQQSQELGLVWNNLGLLMMERDNYLDAADMFQTAADLMPESAEPLYNLGLIYSRRGYDEKAMGYYEKALVRQSSHPASLRAAVLACKQLDRADEPSLARVRRALLVEKDPRWRRLEESEQFRIEGALTRAKEAAPMALPPDAPAMGETGKAPASPPPPGAEQLFEKLRPAPVEAPPGATGSTGPK